MQDPRIPLSEEITNMKPRKKKVSPQKVTSFPLRGRSPRDVEELETHLPVTTGLKSSKRVLKKEASPPFQNTERSNSDSLPDSSTSGNEYRTLRRKYLLLEEESFSMGRELKEVEDEVKALENEKLALLDQLIVLEGLVDPSELQGLQ